MNSEHLQFNISALVCYKLQIDQITTDMQLVIMVWLTII